MERKKNAFYGSNKNFIKFPQVVFEINRLKKLDLSNNEIKDLPKEIDKLIWLELLNLHRNKIRILFAKLFDLRKLKTLILSNNSIVSIPKQISHLTSLKILDLSNNKLTELPKEIELLENLEELNISGNNFTKFPKEILKLNKLKSLWIAKNDFEDFPINEIKKRLPLLKRLYCYSYLRDQTLKNISKEYLRLTQIRGNVINELTEHTSLIQLKPNIESKKTIKNSQIFISYSHNDKDWVNRLTTHLKVLQFEGNNFDYWSDDKIKPGDDWKNEIKIALENADIGILMLSTSFLASDFIRTNELPPLLIGAQNRGAKILSVIVSPCRFRQTKGISDFQAVNDPNKTLQDCNTPDQERVFLKLISVLETYLER